MYGVRGVSERSDAYERGGRLTITASSRDIEVSVDMKAQAQADQIYVILAQFCNILNTEGGLPPTFRMISHC